MGVCTKKETGSQRDPEIERDTPRQKRARNLSGSLLKKTLPEVDSGALSSITGWGLGPSPLRGCDSISGFLKGF